MAESPTAVEYDKWQPPDGPADESTEVDIRETVDPDSVDEPSTMMKFVPRLTEDDISPSEQVTDFDPVGFLKDAELEVEDPDDPIC